MRSLQVLLILGALCTLAVCPALGQTTFATITGVVTDPNGAVIPSVAIEAVHLLNNYRYATRSNEVGIYTLAQLREGQYTLRAKAGGFEEYVVEDIQLAARDVRRINLQLQIGAVATKMEVTAGAALIETETARIADSKDGTLLRALPLTMRRAWDYFQLAPNVSKAGRSWDLRFAGSRTNQFSASIDGIAINSAITGVISPLMDYTESYQELRVDVANNSAEFNGVGQVTIVSKSGTNQFRGSAYDYYGTPMFRARNPFALVRAPGISHQHGGSGGGPIYLPRVYDGRNRSFFFLSGDRSRGSKGQQLINATVPLAAWRAGDFSALAPGTVVRDPSARAPFPGNLIPAGRINSVSQRLQDRFYPLPNFGDPKTLSSQNYRESKVVHYRPFEHYVTARLDHRLSESGYLFGRVTAHHLDYNLFDGGLPTIGRENYYRDNQAASLTYTHTLRPNLLSETRWGMGFARIFDEGPLRGKEVVRELGLKGLADDLPDVSGIFKVSFSGLGLTGISQTDYQNPGNRSLSYQFEQHLSWFRGRHGLKSGVMLRRPRYTDHRAPASLFGNATFSNRFTGHPYADFLLGIPTTSSRAFPGVREDSLVWLYDFFLTDDFKVNSKLTVNWGLRYEYHPGWRETSGRMSLFDIASGKIVVPEDSLNKLSSLMPPGYVDVVGARQAGLPSNLLRTDRNNFAPRIGLAWRPWGTDTVFRAGFGIYYDITPRMVSIAGSPFVIAEPSFTNPQEVPVVVLPQVFPASVAGPTTVSLPTAVRPDLVVPYSMQYNVTIEHQHWNTGFRLSYMGTNTRQGEWSYNINQPVPDSRPFADKPRRFPAYPGISYLTNGAGHQYHAVTAAAQRRMASGLHYHAYYTLARDIGDLERGQSPENAYDRKRERGVWEDIPTHRLSVNSVYELPFGKGKPLLGGAGRLVSTLASHWELSGIYVLQSGMFLTPSWTGPDPTGTAYSASRTPANVTLRPNHLRDANLPADQRSVKRWYDVAAFAPPTPGYFGTAARGVIKGPGRNLLHGGIAKYFPLRERMRIRWELAGTNLLNHPNWTDPGINITSLSQAGVINAVGYTGNLDQDGPRQLRMLLRLEW